MRTAVTGHDARLTTYDDQNSPVAEDEDPNDDDDERCEVPDAVNERGHLTLPENVRVTDAIDHGACRKHESHVVRDAGEPCERHRRNDHPPRTEQNFITTSKSTYGTLPE